MTYMDPEFLANLARQVDKDAGLRPTPGHNVVAELIRMAISSVGGEIISSMDSPIYDAAADFSGSRRRWTEVVHYAMEKAIEILEESTKGNRP